ncbi:CBS domain-containing protein [Rubrivivax gelatinosus]|uniref:CBS domain-containing protein n=2 Tax=Rubrivivax gelatinosus TaxID=28068 RepID=A0ABS1DNN5_RUBGE|nr:CBS domain-containing protein [Rubrivivax gelatinosus]MBK1711326.1 CBS domain-containing protein [Rubrivivax gelatinosus]
MNTIADVMTRDPIAIRPKETVQRAAQLMDELNVGCLPVCEDWQVRGIVTDRDITVRAIAAGLDPAVTEIGSVMSAGVRCCSQRQPAAEVLRQMSAVQIRRLPVVDDLGRLVGIVSLGDMAATGTEGVEETLRCISTPAGPDRAAA